MRRLAESFRKVCGAVADTDAKVALIAKGRTWSQHYAVVLGQAIGKLQRGEIELVLHQCQDAASRRCPRDEVRIFGEPAGGKRQIFGNDPLRALDDLVAMAKGEDR